MAGPSLEALRLMLGDLERSVQTQIQAGESLDDKAGSLIRFGSLVVGLLMTGTSFLFTSREDMAVFPPWISWAVTSGVLLMGVPLLWALWAYRMTTYRYGLRASDVAAGLDSPLSEEEHLRLAVEAYADGIEVNQAAFSRNVLLLNIAFGAFIPGMLLLAASTAGLITEALP